MSPSAVHALQGFLRLFCSEARRIGDHHLGQSDDGIQRRAQLVVDAGDELRLVLAGLLELSVFLVDFVEQPHVLDRLLPPGRRRLQFDLILGNGRTKVRSNWSTPIGIPSRQEWHGEQRAITAFLLSCK